MSHFRGYDQVDPEFKMIDTLKLLAEFDAKEGSFLMALRGELRWDEIAFKNLTKLMYKVALAYQGNSEIPIQIAQGFWFCDS